MASGTLTAEDLQAWRKQTRLSYRRCAALLGVNASLFYKWERGQIPITPKIVVALDEFRRRCQPGQIPASADVLFVMRVAGVTQETAVRILGGKP